MDRRIAIYVIGPRGFPDVQGGIEKFSEGIYPGLARLGYNITSFVLNGFSTYKEWKGIKFIRLPSPRIKSLEKLIYSLLATLYCIIKRPDIVHIHSITSGTFIFMLKLFRVKVVARYNSRDYLHSKWGSLGKYILYFSEKQFLLADFIIANNRGYVVYLQSLGRTKNIAYVPNGVEIPNQSDYKPMPPELFSGITENSKFVLYVGRITSEKNIHTLIDAFNAGSLKNISLVMAGDMAHNDNYFTSLKNKYLNENIIFLGKVSREKLNYLYANCLLFVIPSFYEGTPNVLLEAMSFNCKVLASGIPAHLEFRLDESSYFDPNNAHELKDKILQKLSVTKVENFESIVEQHKWPAIIEQVHVIHGLLLSKKVK